MVRGWGQQRLKERDPGSPHGGADVGVQGLHAEVGPGVKTGGLSVRKEVWFEHLGRGGSLFFGGGGR